MISNLQFMSITLIDYHQYQYQYHSISFHLYITRLKITVAKHFYMLILNCWIIQNLFIFNQYYSIRSNILRLINNPVILFVRTIKFNANIKIGSQKIEVQKVLKEDVSMLWEKIDLLGRYKKNSEAISIVCFDIMNKPANSQQIKQDKQIKKYILKKVQKNKDEPLKVMEILRGSLQSQNCKVTYSKKANIKTQLSIKALSTGFLMDRVKCEEKIEDGDTQWTFEIISKNPIELSKFENYYKKKTAKDYGITAKQIVIHQISKGSLNVEWSTSEGNALESSQYLKKYNKVKIHPYFQSFQLSPQDFDPTGNITFSKDSKAILTRGKWPYYQPTCCTRYGLNVTKKYDNKDDSWLLMNGNPKQWTVAFHGIRNPSDKSKNSQMPILNSTFKGLDQGTMLMKGDNNRFAGNISVNTNEKINIGIYCTPHVQTAFGYAGAIQRENVKQKYHLIFQCRVNPKKIKVCPGQQDYWVINESQDI